MDPDPQSSANDSIRATVTYSRLSVTFQSSLLACFRIKRHSYDLIDLHATVGASVVYPLKRMRMTEACLHHCTRKRKDLTQPAAESGGVI